MKNREQIREFYRTELVPHIRGLESLRTRVNRWNLAVLGFALLLVSAFILAPWLKVDSSVLLNKVGPSGLVGTVLGIFFLLAMGIIFYRRLWGEYRSQYKRLIVSRVVSRFDSNWDYDPSRGLPQSLYERSEIFRKRVDRYHSEDGISGKVDGKFFACSEIHTQTEVGSGKNRRYVDIFRGLMVALEFDRARQGKTIVLPDLAEKHLGNYFGKIIQDFNFTRADLVNMENPSFEKHFVVYSDNSLEAHHILTPGMMERLLRLRSRGSQKIALSFMHNRVFIAVPLRKDYFEPRPFQKVNLGDIEILFEVLSLIRQVMDEVRTDEKVSA